MDISHYIRMLDDLLHSPQKIKDFVFSVFDLSSDSRICEHDLFQVMGFFKDEASTDVFLRAFADDVCVIRRAIDTHKKQAEDPFVGKQRHAQSLASKGSSPVSSEAKKTEMKKGEGKKRSRIQKLNGIIEAWKEVGNSPKSQIIAFDQN